MIDLNCVPPLNTFINNSESALCTSRHGHRLALQALVLYTICYSPSKHPFSIKNVTLTHHVFVTFHDCVDVATVSGNLY